ncbi:hypothetical protein N8615_03965, partial [Verrucomicrobiales bacterium]|nr:hypothetical protein [Verrucomicrobiales bacterium]
MSDPNSEKHDCCGGHNSDSPKSKPSPAAPGSEYTCPMHPEIVDDEPGDCPKCGMALEPIGVPAAPSTST